LRSSVSPLNGLEYKKIQTQPGTRMPNVTVNDRTSGPDDSLIRKTELVISGVLRGGVLLSVAVILVGILYYYALRLLGRLIFALIFVTTAAAVLAVWLWKSRRQDPK
jgi:hypothetical protein